MIKNLSIDPTYECNKKCFSCRCPDIAKFYSSSKKLTFATLEQLLLDFRHIGGKNVFIFGGEPLLAQNTYFILKKAKKLNLNTSISTNAICLSDREVSEKLLSCNPDSVIISLMGIGEINHRINKVARGIQNIVNNSKASLILSAHVTVHSGNINELTGILEFALKQRLRKISYQYVSRIDNIDNKNMKKIFPYDYNMKLNHWNLPRNILLSRGQIKILQKEIINIENIAKNENIELFIDPIFRENFNINVLLTGRFVPQKNCILSDIIVTPNGDLALCPMLQHAPVANINNIKLEEYVDVLNFYNKQLNTGKFLPICHGCCKHTMFYNG
jgi:MoaA/NifB/PqqE/SkfB family radical SAM enzyme